MAHDQHDHEVWMRCFVSVLRATGGKAIRVDARPARIEPPALAAACAVIADAALEEERRRREPEHQMFTMAPKP